MIRRSLRWRLALGGAAAILAALGVAAFGLALLFDRHVERVAVADLDARALALAALVAPDGGASLRGARIDPRYDQPFSGHYWQMRLGDDLVRSRSLWDVTLDVQAPAPRPGERQVHTIAGPQGEPLLAVDRSLLVGAGNTPLRILVATRREELARARQAFLGDLLPYLSLLAVLLIAASWVQILIGLRPFAEIGARIASLASGRRLRIGRDLPAEVLPLATQIDTLLDARDRELERARHRAADLAHGLKTPLQALIGDAGQLRGRGETAMAEGIETVVLSMRRLVDRELARARIQSRRGTASAEPAVILRRIVAVLRRTATGDGIDWRIGGAAGLRARIDPDDLTEALGALLENAMRHARSTVLAEVGPDGDHVTIRIADDGPGVPGDQIARLVQRGVRLDEAGDGQGIGLAIVSEIVEAAEGCLLLETAAPGFVATIRLHRAAD